MYSTVTQISKDLSIRFFRIFIVKYIICYHIDKENMSLDISDDEEYQFELVNQNTILCTIVALQNLINIINKFTVTKKISNDIVQ
jgi:hypothetical protein